MGVASGYLATFSFFALFVLFRPSYFHRLAGTDWLRPFPFRLLIHHIQLWLMGSESEPHTDRTRRDGSCSAEREFSCPWLLQALTDSESGLRAMATTGMGPTA